jgi:hypothetical protein
MPTVSWVGRSDLMGARLIFDMVDGAVFVYFAASISFAHGKPGPSADQLRAELEAARHAGVDRSGPDMPQDPMRRAALEAERALLLDWRQRGLIHDDVYHHLEDELDRLELELTPTGATWLEALTVNLLIYMTFCPWILQLRARTPIKAR